MIPSAPLSCASVAAHTGSGSQVRRAWRTVATWSTLTLRAGRTALRAPGGAVRASSGRPALETSSFIAEGYRAAGAPTTGPRPRSPAPLSRLARALGAWRPRENLYTVRRVHGAVMPDFEQRFQSLKSEIVAEGERVTDLVLRAVEAYFERDQAASAAVVRDDAEIDRMDIAIERASVPLLAMGETDHHRIRSVLTVVKINNELERAANCAVNIAEVILHFDDADEAMPKTFRVMANSVIGMLRDSVRALDELDPDLARRILDYDDAVDQFKRQISLDAERKVAASELSVGFAFRLRTVVSNLERIADHCTNVCQQVIYLQKGMTVRHGPSGWSEPALPDV